MTPDDSELLRRFEREGSQEAFAELVRRHLNLVYSVALRRTGGDAHRAADVSQDVFVDLARKAGALSGHPVLTGWLYTSTRHAADQAVRTERRRTAREQEAHMRNEINAGPVTEADWIRLRPVLDDAMGELDDADRTAVLLRYFESRPFADIGRALHLSEEAARKRVERALTRLETLLSRRGITSTGSAMAALLTAHATVGAPAALAGRVTLAAAGEAALGAATAGSWQAILTATAVALLLGVGGVAWEWQSRTALQEEIRILETRATASRRLERAAPPAPAPILSVETPPVAAPPPRVIPVTLEAPVRAGFLTEKLALDFPPGDARGILRNMADIFNFKVTFPDGFQGKIAVKMTDAPVWQILQNVLTPLGYTFVVEVDGVRIEPLPDEAAKAAALITIAGQNQRDPFEAPSATKGPLAPAAVFQPVPNYPEALRGTGASEVVHIQFTIDETGAVIEAYPAMPGRKQFEEAALETVRRWRYAPVEDSSGRAVRRRTTIQVPISFDSAQPQPRVGLPENPLLPLGNWF